MTRTPVDKVMAKIASLKKQNPYTTLLLPDAEIDRMLMARVHAFELCEHLIAVHILTEHFDEGAAS